MSLPLALGGSVSQLDTAELASFSLTAWASMFYLAVISQSLGMMRWYRVLPVVAFPVLRREP